MKRNVGKTDKIIRVIVGVLLIVLFFTDVLTGTLGIIALIAAGIALGTAMVNICGIYKLVGISSCKMTNPKK